MHRGVGVSLLVAVLGAVTAFPPRLLAVSFQEERMLGAQFALAARTKLPLITDPDVVGYVDTIGQRIARQLDDSFFSYHFYVVGDSSINAFAVPGGYIYVHSGLLTRAANDDEIAAVIGHEIAHVHAHHLARQQESTQLMNYAALLGMLLSIVQPAIGGLATAASQAVQLSYQRQFEQEADFMGARYMNAAGYDPRSMLDFFKKLADQHRSSPTLMPPYLQSHPLTDERLNRLEAVMRAQQWDAHARPEQSVALRRVQVIATARNEAPADTIALYRQLVERNPNDPMTRYLFGLACLEAGELEGAQVALEVAREAGVPEANRDLGRVALRLGDFEKAQRLLNGAVEINPQDALAYEELAKAHEARGNNEAAMTAYRRAIALAPHLESAHHGLGILAGRAGDEAEGYYELATESYLRGDYERALKQYGRAEQLLSPSDMRLTAMRDNMKLLSAFLDVDVPETPRPGGVPTRPSVGP